MACLNILPDSFASLVAVLKLWRSSCYQRGTQSLTIDEMEQDFFTRLCVGPFCPDQGFLREPSLCFTLLTIHLLWETVYVSVGLDDEMTLQCLEDDITVKIENRLAKGRNKNKSPNMESRAFKNIHAYDVIYNT